MKLLEKFKLAIENKQKRMLYKRMLNLSSPKEKFTKIYKTGLWESKESGSGEGSEMRYTEILRSELPIIVSKYEIKSIVDAPCGDLNWMNHVLKNIDIQYTGIDIVEDVILKNQKLYQDQNTNFLVADICNSKIPDADIIIARDFLFHLSFGDIDQYLKNLKKTNYKYLLTTTHKPCSQSIENKDIKTGDFRLIDLLRKPFNVDANKIIYRFDDFIEGFPPREMILIKKEDFPTSLAAK